LAAARTAVDAALAATPMLAELWRARLALEPYADPAAVTVVERWQAAQPDSLDALEARGVLHDAMGETAQAEAVLQALVERDPGRTGAETRLLEGLLQRDPAAAVARVRELIARAPNDAVKTSFGGWLGYALDKAGDYAGAAVAWAEHQAWLAPQRWPLPEPSLPSAEWPARAQPGEDAKPFALLWGAPGAGSEVLVRMLLQAGLPVRAERFGGKVPQDLFQRDASIQALVDGTLDPAAAFAEWQAGLPPPFQRGVIEWVPFWDNALLRALLPAWPHGQAIFALRDPRDMLLDWLAYGAPAPFAMPTPMRAAGWLAMVLNQIAQLDEDGLYPHRIVRLDTVRVDPQPIMAELGGALGLDRIFVPELASLGPERFAAGHWRHYAQALAEPFAVLAPVAHRLGYSRD
jgi:tetratricopeptide (TPR) repeat protein